MNEIAKRNPTPLERHKDGGKLLNHSTDGENPWDKTLDVSCALFDDGSLYISELIKTSNEAGHIIREARTKHPDVRCHFVADTQTRELFEFLNTSRANANDNETDAESFLAFKQLLIEADRRGASDIHLFVRGNILIVQFRVNTYLEAGESFQAEFGRSLLRSVYFQCDEAEQSFNEVGPMAGMIKLKKYNLDVKYETARCNWQWNSEGHELVVRLQKPLPTRDLRKLGYEDKRISFFDELVDNTTGTHIFCGPTGSGKSTLQHILCAIQFDRLHGAKKFKGFADPEEFVMPFNQISINVGSDPEKRRQALLECFLAEMRMDLDYANFGEIRDKATANAIMGFVQSGHFAWASMHAISPDRIIPQIRGLGVEDLSLFESSIISTGIGQRLLPKLCSCADRLASSKDARDKAIVERFTNLGVDGSTLRTRRLTGCSKCRGGITGMLPILEVLKFDDDIMGLYREGKDHLIKGIIKEKQLPSFWDDALPKIIEGSLDPKAVEGVFGYASADKFRADNVFSAKS